MTFRQPVRSKRSKVAAAKRLTCDEFITKKAEEGGSLPLNPPKSRPSDPVNRLTRTLRKYKEKRISSENELVKIMQKVRLDKTILIKEKIDSIWGSMEGSNYKQVKHEIDKCKHRRQETVTRQKEAYQKLLSFLKDRRKQSYVAEAKGAIPNGDKASTLPAAEEKQIIDAIKVVLENGYTVGDYEIRQIFDLIGLRGMAVNTTMESVDENSHMPFLEFVFYMGKLFNLNLAEIQDYFLGNQEESPRDEESPWRPHINV